MVMSVNRNNNPLQLLVNLFLYTKWSDSDASPKSHFRARPVPDPEALSIQSDDFAANDKSSPPYTDNFLFR